MSPVTPVTDSAAAAVASPRSSTEAFIEQGLETAVPIALGAVSGGAALPFSGAAVAAIQAIFAAYDAITAGKPANVTDAEWRAYLTKPALTQTGDDYINAARLAAAVTTGI